MEGRIDGLEERVNEIEKRMIEKFGEVDKRFNEIDKKFDDINKRFNEIEQKMVTKDDIAKIKVTIDGLGARWGVRAEETFRQGVVEILKNTGYEAKKEILYDKDGFVYGEPSDVEYDVVVKDGKVILIEITSTYRRNDTELLLKKREFYEKVKGVKVDHILVITAEIYDRDPDRVRARADSLGIKIVTPLDLDG